VLSEFFLFGVTTRGDEAVSRPYLVDLRQVTLHARIFAKFDSELGKTVALLQKIADDNFSKTVVFETRVALSTSVALICFV
jgi:hypothetical protein